MRTLLSCVMCATMILGGNMQTNTIQQYLTSSSGAQVIIDNHYSNIQNIDKLNNVLNHMLENSYEMPAFGVSIHIETLQAIQTGVWLKLQYNGTQYFNDMPFDELLIEVNPDFEGFNIIRGNKGIYEGRCYYINLIDNNMQNLYYYLTAQ